MQSSSSQSLHMPLETHGSSVNLCIMAHGLMGSKHDWDVWMDMLQERFPDWVLWPLSSLVVNRGTSFMGDSVKALSNKAAIEMVIAIRSQLLRGCSKVTVHCIGHSMGGLVLRGALPRVLEELPETEASQVQFGHYMALSSPQLGVQAGWAVPWLWWRNLSKYTGRFSGQLTQLAIQDGKKHELPYLAALADKDGKYVAALRKFKCRTCVSMTTGDPLIPTCSGLIQRENPFNKSFLQSGFKGTWRFEAREGTNPNGSFEYYLRSNLISRIPQLDVGTMTAASSMLANSQGSALGLTPFLRNIESEDPFNLRSKSSAATTRKDDEIGSEKSTMASSGSACCDDMDEECCAFDAVEPLPQKLPQNLSRRRFTFDSKSSAAEETEGETSTKSTSASSGTNTARNIDAFRSPTFASSVSYRSNSISSETSNYVDHEVTARCKEELPIDEGLVKAWLKKKGFKDVNTPKIMRKGRKKFPLHSAVKDNDAEMVWLLLKLGANVDAQNSENQTAAEVAEQLQVNGSHQQLLELLAHADDLFECRPSSVCSVPLSWRTSADGAVRFPQEALEGLCSVSWQRIPVTASLLFKNMHVFLMAKRTEQRALENRLSRECVRCLVEILAD
eukprot:CAMPEP_0169087334 /NCGR_PEP_ID=MMETSP1015-20121227/14175_1 /TAXON_ID=342587 /ORGANISM="Karlodinium micrum, Strain CCMP2283" /LENGTH=617 /DNA_ID=CAMNT_0009147555 /DNA_START=99 /DNA_END=1952 /DNA_ORIENTATION=-